MKKITDIFSEKEKTYSFELFPPKTEKGEETLFKTIKELCALKPDFISCTYGAGGGNRSKTMDIIQHIQEKHHVTGLAHLTCVLNTKDEIKNILKDIKTRNIQNVLALRGDPPMDQPDWVPSAENFCYSKDLCQFIGKNFPNNFTIGVAGFPEGHTHCASKQEDAHFLKMKSDAGADFVITQLFFDNQDYFDYVKRLRTLGVGIRIIPGIIPITNYPGLLNFTNICGARISDKVKEIFEPIKEDKEATLKEGIQFAINQCKELLDGGAPGLHFFTLNKASPIDKILSEVKK